MNLIQTLAEVAMICEDNGDNDWRVNAGIVMSIPHTCVCKCLRVYTCMRTFIVCMINI